MGLAAARLEACATASLVRAGADRGYHRRGADFLGFAVVEIRGAQRLIHISRYAGRRWAAYQLAAGQQDNDHELALSGVDEGTEPSQMCRAPVVGAGAGLAVDRSVRVETGSAGGSIFDGSHHAGLDLRN